MFLSYFKYAESEKYPGLLENGVKWVEMGIQNDRQPTFKISLKVSPIGKK